MASPVSLVTHITNTATRNLRGVYFEDIGVLVSSKSEAWLVSGFLFRYYSSKEAALKYLSSIGRGEFA